MAWSPVFTIADHALSNDPLDARAATTSSLLVLGVPADRVIELLDARVKSA